MYSLMHIPESASSVPSRCNTFAICSAAKAATIAQTSTRSRRARDDVDSIMETSVQPRLAQAARLHRRCNAGCASLQSARCRLFQVCTSTALPNCLAIVLSAHQRLSTIKHFQLQGRFHIALLCSTVGSTALLARTDIRSRFAFATSGALSLIVLVRSSNRARSLAGV